MLEQIGIFSDAEIQLFKNNICKKYLDKNQILSKEGDVSRSLFFIEKGAFYQFYKDEDNEKEIITDLYTENDWVFNAESLAGQIPAKVTIKAFEHSEVLEITLEKMHELISVSQRFLQFNKLLITSSKLIFYDQNLTPAEKYHHLLTTKPQLLQIFPLTMIASYLKIRPETLSRIRSRISF
nr:Crp/Fnr family transcriptional regulator [uncultured Chryseobacterium sp.]